ncbi:unnamed protein product [Arctia plantaginis]|uniref:UDP-glucuronosyltransferase n=1 Tax=Arctia plantaginis TaxID=874455 RepID=A0A8S1AIA0_ARCPL|nr:unnamed protein product [Arctia plantaginis]
MSSLREEEFRNAIITVIGDERYRRNIVRLRELMRDEPMKPLERAVWWTEYVLRHGGAPHLRSPAANMSWPDYMETDLILTILFVLFIVLIVTSVILLKICHYIRNRLAQRSKKKSS